MKIVFRGQLPEDKLWEGTCYRCRSVIEAKQSELTIDSCQREGTWGIAKCPVRERGLNQMIFYSKEQGQ